MNSDNEVKTLPLFPLGVFLFPNEVKTLHIFEEKYRNLFQDLEEKENLFGIPFVMNGQLMDCGCIVRLEKILNRYITGESDVLIKCGGYFRTNSYFNEHQERLYPFGDVELFELKNIYASKKLLGLFADYSKDILKTSFSGKTIFSIASNLNMMDWEKFDLCNEADESKIDNRLSNIIKIKTELANQLTQLGENTYPFYN